MTTRTPEFEVRLATDTREVEASQRLRYDVFVEELGGSGEMVDHEARLERDKFDPHFDHILIFDRARDNDDNEQVVGVYRVLRGDKAKEIGGFYSAGEYDLSVLETSGRNLLELGRSCLHKDYRGGFAMYHLWTGLAKYTLEHDIEVLFGVASFHGTDPEKLAGPLSLLRHRHLAPPELRVRAQPRHYQPMDLLAENDIDRASAMLQTPALIKAYLRLGGFIGDGAFIDHEFNTTDVCLILDTARMNERQRAIYTRDLAA
ncbi:GNAT family N-acetyltransferase [Qingshengfaniella alkalisoli]|uniref:L-ornithine N(alpha)-acyltransferase n=1 Tax=Qingshengfaniella alkalisoli TaxID=2599296 RepID=A0A5B8IVQ3_9RHOB|nr:GNAT family N-acyltransferase [Qingshengfaniella alkalisoli]QDY68951.1 GNAT family N-acetyltransferase [Qingshengfaniella alkalisoli]